MKNLLFIALLFASTAAFADNSVATPSVSPPGQSAGSAPPQKAERFEEMKAKALERIQQHLAKLQEKQACVQAATTPEALKICLPKMGEHRGKWGNGEGKGGGFGGGRFNKNNDGNNSDGAGNSENAPGQQ
ncbi:MAG: hypothetical protein EPN97_08375 [Alphaproteobacteria bacterium]|nr:MAG: hypothetical protein EPN97_08375 [Alphaproteobacteria bacterium]